MQHSEVCKKAKEDVAAVLKGFEVSQSLKDYINQVSLDALQRAVPYYFVLSEDLASTAFTDLLTTLKKF